MCVVCRGTPHSGHFLYNHTAAWTSSNSSTWRRALLFSTPHWPALPTYHEFEKLLSSEGKLVWIRKVLRRNLTLSWAGSTWNHTQERVAYLLTCLNDRMCVWPTLITALPEASPRKYDCYEPRHVLQLILINRGGHSLSAGTGFSAVSFLPSFHA